MIGQMLGPYQVLSKLGEGGMGEVYRARDTRLDRFVALKLLPAAVATDPDRLSRFEREARAASALNHPSIVTIYDIGSADLQSWISMELVDGQTLRDLLANGPLPLRRALTLAAQIADGLAKAHEAGIVHRDLKPENVMVTADGFAKVLDFGLARLAMREAEPDFATRTAAADTKPGTVLGTLAYMSPEQASGAPVDFRSDQFSFGAVFYEMLTGQRAFAKPTSVDTLSAVLRDEPTPMGQLNPAIPAPVRWIVERMVEKSAADRYASTRDLARDLATPVTTSRRCRRPVRRPARRPPPARDYDHAGTARLGRGRGAGDRRRRLVIFPRARQSPCDLRSGSSWHHQRTCRLKPAIGAVRTLTRRAPRCPARRRGDGHEEHLGPLAGFADLAALERHRRRARSVLVARQPRDWVFHRGQGAARARPAATSRRSGVARRLAGLGAARASCSSISRDLPRCRRWRIAGPR